MIYIIHIIDIKVVVGKEEDIQIAGERKLEELDVEKNVESDIILF